MLYKPLKVGSATEIGQAWLAHSPHRRLHTAFQRLEAWRLALQRSLNQADARDARASPVRGEDFYTFDPRLARARMPWMARRILQSTDLEQVARRRRDNYRLCVEQLGSSSPVRPFYPVLPTGCCPWVLPVMLTNRDVVVDRQWRAAGVALHTFGIYLHSALDAGGDCVMVDDARFLAREVLCLAIHQDLGPQEIKHAAAVILGHPTP